MEEEEEESRKDYRVKISTTCRWTSSHERRSTLLMCVRFIIIHALNGESESFIVVNYYCCEVHTSTAHKDGEGPRRGSTLYSSPSLVSFPAVRRTEGTTYHGVTPGKGVEDADRMTFAHAAGPFLSRYLTHLLASHMTLRGSATGHLLPFPSLCRVTVPFLLSLSLSFSLVFIAVFLPLPSTPLLATQKRRRRSEEKKRGGLQYSLDMRPTPTHTLRTPSYP